MSTKEQHPLAGVLTDEDLAELQRRNSERARRAIDAMGEQHLLHPAHSPRRPAAPGNTNHHRHP